MPESHEASLRDEEISGLAAAGAASLGVGAALTAGAASACCVGPVAAPLIAGVLGAGGAAWAASLEPFSPLLLSASGLLLAFSFWSLYHRRARPSCEAGERARVPWKLRLARGVVWLAAAFWGVALGLNVLFAS